MIINTAESSGSQGKPFLSSAPVYSLRIIEVEGKKTQKAPPRDMLVVKYEICAPESVQIEGKDHKIAGLQLTDWIVDPSGNSRALNNLSALTKLCKGNPQVDLENQAMLKTNYLGKALKVSLRTEPKPLMTVDEQGNSVPVVDDNGNVVSDNNYRISRFIGADDRFTIPSDSVAPY